MNVANIFSLRQTTDYNSKNYQTAINVEKEDDNDKF